MYYIVCRDDDSNIQIVGPIPEGQDPLYGYGSWILFDTTPYPSREAAEAFLKEYFAPHNQF